MAIVHVRINRILEGPSIITDVVGCPRNRVVDVSVPKFIDDSLDVIHDPA